MSTICSMIQGCGPYDQFRVDIVKSKDFPPPREIRIGISAFSAPAAGTSKNSVFGPAGEYITPENAGITVAHAVSAALKNVPNVILAERTPPDSISGRQNPPGIGNGPKVLSHAEALAIDALLTGDVTSFQRWYDLAGRGGIVDFDARLIDAASSETLFSMTCTAVRRDRTPEELAKELAAQAIMKLLER